MSDVIRSWLYGLLFSGCLCSLILYINPDGKLKNLLETACACVMTLALISPMGELLSVSELNSAFAEMTLPSAAELQTQSQMQAKQFIEAEYSAYIVTEAKGFGIEPLCADVEVMQDENGNWLPKSVTYTSEAPVTRAFQSHIEHTLGIPFERQSTYETNQDTRNHEKHEEP